MRPTARRLISILAMSVIAAGCAATEPASEAPASAATTVTTSAATTTTSTTTTTLPPGLQPQILEHGFGNRTMVSHDVAHHVTISFETTGAGLDSTMPSRLETTIEGDQRTLYLETNQAGIFEAISDFKGTEGSLSFTIDGTEINQEIDAEEAAEYPMSGPPTLIGTNGAAITGRTGAPATRSSFSGRSSDRTPWTRGTRGRSNSATRSTPPSRSTEP